jgi:hypothetical protein
MKEVQQLEELPVPILEFIGVHYQRCALIVFVCTILFLVIFVAGRKISPPRRTEELVSLEDAI